MFPFVPTAVSLLGLVLVGPDDAFTKIVDDELHANGEDVRRERVLAAARPGDRIVRIASRDLAEHWRMEDSGLVLVSTTRLTSDDRTDALVVAERSRELAASVSGAKPSEPTPAPVTARPRLDVHAGSGPTFGTGSTGVMMTGGLRWHALSRLRVSIVAQTNLGGQAVSNEVGSTKVREVSFGGAVDTPVWATGLEVDVGASVLASHLSAEGVARPPYSGVSDATWTALLGVHVFASLPVTDALRIGVRPQIAFAPVATQVRFGGVEAATWGSPHVTVPLVLLLTPGALR